MRCNEIAFEQIGSTLSKTKQKITIKNTIFREKKKTINTKTKTKQIVSK